MKGLGLKSGATEPQTTECQHHLKTGKNRLSLEGWENVWPCPHLNTGSDGLRLLAPRAVNQFPLSEKKQEMDTESIAGFGQGVGVSIWKGFTASHVQDTHCSLQTDAASVSRPLPAFLILCTQEAENSEVKQCINE